MRRRQVVALLGAAALSGLVKPAGAQAPAGKTWRLGYLAPASIPHLLDAFKKGLHDMGYVEGQNLMIEYRFGEGPAQIFDKLAANLVQLAPDVIVTVATPATIRQSAPRIQSRSWSPPLVTSWATESSKAFPVQEAR